VHHPQAPFPDDPTTGLDPEVRVSMWDEISRLANQDGLTILLTTHYLEEADQLARRVAIVDRGRVVAEGSPAELKAELRGDAVEVELAAPEANGRVHDALARLGGIREVMLEGRVLRARVDDGPPAVPSVLAVLESAGVKAETVTGARPSLADVYLRYAGRTFSDAEEGGDQR
jgi:ABC-2 type transport system ATP-binding protein